ncbi:MAG: hypothetical protein WBB67_05850 [bacterium]
MRVKKTGSEKYITTKIGQHIHDLYDNFETRKLRPTYKRIIVYSDIVDSTLTALRLRSKTMRRCFIGYIGCHHNLIEKVINKLVRIQQSRGIKKNKSQIAKIGNMWGDGVVLTFNSIEDAIESVFEIRRLTNDDKIHECLSEHFTDDRIILRFGIHAGQYYNLPEGWEKGKAKGKITEMLGLDIHLTQKVQSEAPPSGVYITDEALGLIKLVNKEELRKKTFKVWTPVRIRGNLYTIREILSRKTFLRHLQNKKKNRHEKFRKSFPKSSTLSLSFNKIFQIEIEKITKIMESKLKSKNRSK